MLILAHLNIANAEMRSFEEYERHALALLTCHGGKIVERLRTSSGDTEFHLLEFPDAGAFAAFISDPARTSLDDLWRRCRVTADILEVFRVS